MHFLETKVFRSRGTPRKVWLRLRRPVCLVLTLLVVAGILAVVTFLVIPELARTLLALANGIPPFLAKAQGWVTEWISGHPEFTDLVNRLDIDWQRLGTEIVSALQNGAGALLNSTVGIINSAVNVIVNFFLGFIFACYVLMNKENLGRQVDKLITAYIPARRAQRLRQVASLSYKTFASFLSGQCLEACILGMMFFVVLSVFRFPFALLISVLVAFTALIPIFGAIIAWIVGAILIFTVSPIQALWFLILFQVLQQIEGNLIYPHVVGSSVGLPSIWVLVAVTIGGSTMGVIGMLVFIPLCSVLYALLRDATNRRLAKRAAGADHSPAAEPPEPGEAPPPDAPA